MHSRRGRDSSAGIATSYRLNGPGSIFQYFKPFIGSVFLCINVFAFCTNVTHSVFCTTVYILFTVYVTLPWCIGPIAVGNIYIYIYIY
jgi:hypothetical protein